MVSKVNRLENNIESKENQIKTLTNELRESQKYCEIMAKKNLEMKKEYDKLFAAVSSQKKQEKENSNLNQSLFFYCLFIWTFYLFVEVQQNLLDPDEPIPEERVYKRIISTQEGRIKELNKQVLLF
jgi:hypothetical protein